MSQRTSVLIWASTLLLMLIGGGSPWTNLTLIPDAGSQVISISGFSAFSVAGALVLLQGAAILATLLTQKLVGRIISIALLPGMFWHLIDVTSSKVAASASAISQQITELTGVAGAESQAELVVESYETYWWLVYLIAVCLNLAILGIRGFLPTAQVGKTKQEAEMDDEPDLWESQRPS